MTLIYPGSCNNVDSCKKIEVDPGRSFVAHADSCNGYLSVSNDCGHA
jgi:hypothetical protein